MRWRKARPGMTTEHVKFKRPNKDWSSQRDTLRRKLNWWSKSSYFWSLSSGSRASCLTESRVMLANCRVVNGPMVFSSAIGTLRKSHMRSKFWRSAWHFSLVGAINKKSSKLCTTPEAWNRCLESHSRAELKASKMAQLELQPIGRVRSKKYWESHFMPKRGWSFGWTGIVRKADFISVLAIKQPAPDDLMTDIAMLMHTYLTEENSCGI